MMTTTTTIMMMQMKFTTTNNDNDDYDDTDIADDDVNELYFDFTGVSWLNLSVTIQHLPRQIWEHVVYPSRDDVHSTIPGLHSIH